MADDKKVRFVRIRGRIVPIRGGKGIGAKSKKSAPSVEPVLKFHKYKRDAKTRAKEAFTPLAILGGFLGSGVPSAFGGGARGAAIGAAAGAIGLGAVGAGLGAVIGRREGTRVTMHLQKIKRRKKKGY